MNEDFRSTTSHRASQVLNNNEAMHACHSFTIIMPLSQGRGQ